MATTTPNYGWPVPTSTDLVKDGATAIEALGDAADATMATMIPKSLVDAKGDLIAATAADTVARLAVGANDTVLTADSSTATGLKWATSAAGGMTVLATGTLSSTSVSLSSISQSYQTLYLVVSGASVSATATPLIVRQNGLTSSYKVTEMRSGTTVLQTSTTLTGFKPVENYNVPTGTNQDVHTFTFPQYTLATAHPVTIQGATAGVEESWLCQGYVQNFAAITSLTITTVAGSTFDAGTYTLYGVK